MRGASAGARAGRILVLTMWAALPGCSFFPAYLRPTDPLNSEEHLRLGAAYESQGLKDRAAEQYEAAARLQAGNSSALMALGNLAFRGGDFPRAEALYRRVIAMEPLHVGANNNLAMIALSRHNPQAAEPLALTALAQGGALKPYVLDTLAGIYAAQGRLEEARQSLDEADAIAPAESQALGEQLKNTRNALNAQVLLRRDGS